MYRLSREEYEILKALLGRGPVEIGDLARALGVSIDRLRRPLEALRARGLVRVSVERRERLGPGERLRRLGTLPEVLLYDHLAGAGGRARVDELMASAPIPREDVNPSLGILRRLGAISVTKREDGVYVEVAGPLPEDRRRFAEDLLAGKLDPARYAEILREARRRPGILEVSTGRREVVEITGEGARVLSEAAAPPREVVTALTPELLRTGRWRGVEFKEYDVSMPAPPVYGGKRHPLHQLIDEIREIFVSMGFIEEWGPLIELAFWNFDALFQPQDHPAREMHDTFYLKEPRAGSLDGLGEVVERVRRTHEDGGDTGSRGWRYRWRLEEAARYVLRTHTTAVTARKVYEYGERPVKIFAIGKVFRNETVDYKHLPEFYNVDGIVIDPRTNLRELLGVLKTVFERLGFRRVMFRPSYFPYTEPSVEVCVYDERARGYVELAGSGIFRPEVTIPLGVRWPVLAWGMGVERILMMRYGIEDIRQIYRNDIGWLRRVTYARHHA